MGNLDKDLGKGVIAGLAAGLAATYVMTKFQNLTAKLGEVSERDEPRDPQHSAHRGTAESARQPQEDDATVKAASAISEGVFHHETPRTWGVLTVSPVLVVLEVLSSP